MSEDKTCQGRRKSEGFAEKRKDGGMSVMRHGLRQFWLAVGVWSLLASVAYAATDEHLKSQLVKVLSEAGLKMTGAVNEKFCRQFFKDFVAQEKITHVKPLVQAETYNDPALAPYKSSCPKLGPEEEVELNETMIGQFRVLWQGTANFRLYKGNFNNDASDGDEYIFYFDHLMPKPVDPLESIILGPETAGEYRVVNFESCEMITGIAVDMQRNFERSRKKRPGYNGLITYQGRFYLFDLYPVAGYSMTLWEFSNRSQAQS